MMPTVLNIKNTIFYVVYTKGYDSGLIFGQIKDELNNGCYHDDMLNNVSKMELWVEEKNLEEGLQDFDKKAIYYWNKSFVTDRDFKMMACCVRLYLKNNKVKNPAKRVTFSFHKYELLNTDNYQFDFNGETVWSGYHQDDMFTYKIYGEDGNIYMWHSSAEPFEMDNGGTITASVKSRKTENGITTITITRGSLK